MQTSGAGGSGDASGELNSIFFPGASPSTGKFEHLLFFSLTGFGGGEGRGGEPGGLSKATGRPPPSGTDFLFCLFRSAQSCISGDGSRPGHIWGGAVEFVGSEGDDDIFALQTIMLLP